MGVRLTKKMHGRMCRKVRHIRVSSHHQNGGVRKQGLHWGRYHPGLDTALHPPHQNRMLCERFHVPPSFFVTDPYSNRDVFAVCRNPITRAISEFRCPWKGFCAPARSAQARAKRACATPDTLNEWLMAKKSRGAMSPPFKNGHFIPQSTYFFDHEGRRLIPRSRTLRFESLEEDFEKLCVDYQLVYSALPKVNVSDMPLFTAEDLTPETLQMLETVYAGDFTLLGYDFQSNGA